LTSSRPPIDANVDVLFSMKNSRVALGSTSLRPARKSSRVTCSWSSGRSSAWLADAASAATAAARMIAEKAAQRDHADFLAQRLDVRADEAVRVLGDFRKVHVAGERHRARMYPENLQARLRIGTPISISRSKRPGRRSAGSSTSGIFVAPITITWPRDTNPSIRLNSCATTRFSTSPVTSARFGATGVDFVDEQNRRRAPCRFLEHLSELRLALPVELPHDLGAVQVDEVDAALGRDRAGQQRLAGAGRAVEQHALRRENPQLLEEPRVLERQLHDFAHARDLALETADVLV
jgi:hypothetical protein